VNTLGLAAVLVSVVLVIVGQTLLKMGMSKVGPIDAARVRSPLALLADVASRWQVWVGMSAYVVSSLTWIYALTRLPLSVAYPFLGLSYAGVAVSAVLVLDEWLTPAQIFGILLVVAGVLAVATTG
jgi:multidrug transporter EmrE-like cation transporter